jgi:hypothetical protein
MTKPIEGEILGPTHAYDNPDLSSKEFLLACVHDTRLPISVRIDAASKVSAYEHPRLAQVSSDVTAGVRIIIEGGLPNLPGTNIIMPKTEKTSGNGKA